jgi:hypothetical protein
MMQMLQAGGSPLPNPLATKKLGTIHIGVPAPKAQLGQVASGFDVAEPIRATLVQYLSGPAVEAVPLTSRIAVHMAAEARQKECDCILHADIKKGQSGGKFGKVMRAVGPLATVVPMVGMAGGVGGVVAGTAAVAAIGPMADVTGTIRAKEEVALEYTVTSVETGAVLLTNRSALKVKRDGEDVLTPLIDQLATAVVTKIGQAATPAITTGHNEYLRVPIFEDFRLMPPSWFLRFGTGQAGLG